MGESPRWHDGRLWLSDWGTGEIVAVGLDGRSEVMVGGVGPLPFCFDRLPDGRLLVVSGRDGRVLRLEADGTLVTHADLGALADPPWNEIVVDARGRALRVRAGGEALETVEADRGCFACMLGGEDGRTLFVVANEWHGPEAMLAGDRSGRVMAARAPSPHAGRP